MTRAVLFDLDGTLTDSRPGIFACFRYAFARLAETGGPSVVLPDDEALRHIVGPPLRDSFAYYAGEAHKEALIGFYRERYGPTGAYENSVYDGVTAALEALRGQGARLFVATSKNEADARRILDYFGLAARFESINGARADGSRAGKEAILRDTLATHGLNASACAMIGDREFDMIGARALGLRAVGALWGYGTPAELTGAGADALAQTPGEAARLAMQ